MLGTRWAHGGKGTRLTDSSSGATKRYLRQFVGEMRFDGKRVVMRGRKAALLAAVAEKEMGTAKVPISVPGWLRFGLEPGTNELTARRTTPVPRPEHAAGRFAYSFQAQAAKPGS